MLGHEPMPHQQYAWNVALEIDPETGLLAYDDVTVIGPRQTTGKTQLVEPLLAHRCTSFGPALIDWIKVELGVDLLETTRGTLALPQTVLFAAQRAEDARKRWRDEHVKHIGDSPLSALWAQPPRLRLAAEAMFWANGSKWSPVSATGKAGGTGDTVDLAEIDEAWAQEDGRLELGLRPAMTTRDSPQLWRTSMVPGPSRVPAEKWAYLHNVMMNGRTAAQEDSGHGVCYIEFSADPLADYSDPQTWRTAMPGLGITTPIRNIQSFYRSMNAVDFAAEFLGVIPEGNVPMWQVIREDTWRRLYDGRAYEDPIALAVDATPELTFASIGMAAQRPDGDIHVELIERKAGVNWVLDALLALCRKHSVCAIGIDRNGPLAGLVRPLTRAQIDQNLDITIVEMNSAEVAAACAAFFNETGELDETADAGEIPTLRRVHHMDQPELTASIGGAVKHFHGDRWRWDRVHSASDVSPLLAVTLAVATGDVQEWIGGAYDIRDSLG